MGSLDGQVVLVTGASSGTIAESVAYALTQPQSVAVNEIIVRPLAAQAF